MHPIPERYLTCKELTTELRDLGIRPCGREVVRAVMIHSPDTVGSTLRLSDAISFLKKNRGWRPYGKSRKHPRNPPPVRNSPDILML